MREFMKNPFHVQEIQVDFKDGARCSGKIGPAVNGEVALQLQTTGTRELTPEQEAEVLRRVAWAMESPVMDVLVGNTPTDALALLDARIHRRLN